MALRRRAVGAASVGPVAVMLAAAVTASVAWACTNLATLNLSTADGRVGDIITVSGSGFAVPRGIPAPEPVPVAVHWNGIDGPVLATATPDRPGTFTVTFTVPDALPGNYVLVATQSTLSQAPGGASVTVPALGTPARAGFRVTPVGAPVLRAGTSSPVAGGGTGSDVLLAATVVMVTLCLAAIIVGAIAVTCDPRRRPAPRPAPASRR